METPVREILKDLKRNFLECDVCFEQYDEDRRLPRVLPCQHTFCSVCLKKLIKSSNLNCPACKKDHVTGKRNGINKYPKDKTRRDLMSFIDCHADKEEPLCCVCPKETLAQHYCTEFADYFCDSCFKVKQEYASDQTNPCVKPEVNILGTSEPNRCTLQGHGKCIRKYICLTCKCLACVTCVVETHREITNHTTQEFDDYIAERRMLAGEDYESLHDQRRYLRKIITYNNFKIKEEEEISQGYFDVLVEFWFSKMQALKPNIRHTNFYQNYQQDLDSLYLEKENLLSNYEEIAMRRKCKYLGHGTTLQKCLENVESASISLKKLLNCEDSMSFYNFDNQIKDFVHKAVKMEIPPQPEDRCWRNFEDKVEQYLRLCSKKESEYLALIELWTEKSIGKKAKKMAWYYYYTTKRMQYSWLVLVVVLCVLELFIGVPLLSIIGILLIYCKF